eukprot:COSAG02_NODE_3731_length_6312_cov_32.691453_2_plen_78_part_00
MTASSAMRRASVLTVGVKESVPATFILVPAGAKQVNSLCESTTAQSAAGSWSAQEAVFDMAGRKIWKDVFSVPRVRP